MAPSTLLGIVFCFLATLHVVTATNEYIFKFGSQRIGKQVFDKQGEIGLFSYVNNVYVPRNTKITYLKVTVYSVSPPKVDFDRQSNTVTIRYDWTQITMSKYRIFAQGIEI